MNATSSALLTGLSNLLSYIQPFGVGGILGTLFGYWFKDKLAQNTDNKRKIREAKEQQYKDFLNNLMGFFEGYENKERQKQFVWDVYANAPVYASDEIIRLAYKFINSFNIKDKKPQNERDAIYAELVVAIRRELNKIQGEPETKLKAKDISISRLA